MKKLFIVILNFNGGEDILDCLKSVEWGRGWVKGWQAEILVVDNGSTDNSLQLIKSQYPEVKVIENKKNLGFATGNNIGIKYAIKQKASAVLLLNQDTVASKGFLPPLIKNQADIVAPAIRFKRNRKWVYDLGGKVNWWLGRTTHYESSRKNLKTPPIDYVSGCCILIRQPVLEKIGLLDERFFLYFEDVDFCLRAKEAGFKIGVEPKAVIKHKLVEGKMKPLGQRLQLIKSNLIFIDKHVPIWKRPLSYLSALIFSVKALLL